jgi:hypothetical protein
VPLSTEFTARSAHSAGFPHPADTDHRTLVVGLIPHGRTEALRKEVGRPHGHRGDDVGTVTRVPVAPAQDHQL